MLAGVLVLMVIDGERWVLAGLMSGGGATHTSDFWEPLNKILDNF